MSKSFVCKISVQVFQAIYEDLRVNSVDLDEVAHYEPPHLDLCCLQIQIFYFVWKL